MHVPQDGYARDEGGIHHRVLQGVVETQPGVDWCAWRRMSHTNMPRTDKLRFGTLMWCCLLPSCVGIEKVGCEVSPCSLPNKKALPRKNIFRILELS